MGKQVYLYEWPECRECLECKYSGYSTDPDPGWMDIIMFTVCFLNHNKEKEYKCSKFTPKEKEKE